MRPTQQPLQNRFSPSWISRHHTYVAHIKRMHAKGTRLPPREAQKVICMCLADPRRCAQGCLGETHGDRRASFAPAGTVSKSYHISGPPRELADLVSDLVVLFTHTCLLAFSTYFGFRMCRFPIISFILAMTLEARAASHREALPSSHTIFF
jgi:hypothetical protein